MARSLLARDSWRLQSIPSRSTDASRSSRQAMRSPGQSTRCLLFVAMVACYFVSPSVVDGQGSSRQDDPQATQDATTPPVAVPIKPVEDDEVDRGPRNTQLYQVPQSDRGEDLVRFLRDVLGFQPRTLAEYRLHVERAPEAVQQVADRLIAMETDPARLAFRIGHMASLKGKLIRTPFVDADQQQALIDEILRTHQTFHEQPEVYIEVKRELFDIAKRVARSINQAGNTELAISANRRLGELFASDPDRRLATSGRQMLGTANRLASIGQPIRIAGTLLDGSSFDWEAYRGKTVLVFFMSTVVGPVDAEMPQLKELYREYAEDGFEIVLVALDEKETVISEYIEKNSIVWPCLFTEAASWENPLAVEFGIDELPMGLLVDAEGRLISDRARTAELRRLLQETYGH